MYLFGRSATSLLSLLSRAIANCTITERIGEVDAFAPHLFSRSRSDWGLAVFFSKHLTRIEN